MNGGGAVNKTIKGEEVTYLSSKSWTNPITEDGVYEIPSTVSGIATINASNVKLVGSVNTTYANIRFNVATNDDATLQIKDLHIHHSTNVGTLIAFPKSKTKNKLILKGDNAITGINSSSSNYINNAPIHIGGGLEITGEGTLDCSGHDNNKSAFIGTSSAEKLDSNITISGSVKISGNFKLGAGNLCKAGNIYVCENASVNGDIAGGSSSTCGIIYIYDNASVSGSHIGCGIDSDKKTVSSCSDIIIGGNANVSIVTSSSDIAAIGASKYSRCGYIIIGGNAKVFASGKGDSAAIGSSSGRSANGSGHASSCSGIIIGENARVTAIISDGEAAAIGSGCCGISDTKGSCGNILIGGNASVTAINTVTGKRSGAAIGSGLSSQCRGITIGGSAQVSASVATTFVDITGNFPEYAARPIGNAYNLPGNYYNSSSCGSVVLGKNATVNGSVCTASGYEDINFDVIPK